MFDDFRIGAAWLLCREHHFFHHLADDTVGKDNCRITVFEGKFECQSYEICHFLYGSRSKGNQTIVTVAASFYCLEIVGLARLDGSQTGTAAHNVYNQARQLGTCQIRDTFLL